MMDNFLVFFPIVVPALSVLVPGLALVKKPAQASMLFSYMAEVVLWSVTVLSIGSLFFTSIKLPPALILVFSVLMTVVILSRKTLSTRKETGLRWITVSAFIIILLYGLLAIPFLMKHGGLPTGDSQKAIFWAQDIIYNQRFPQYKMAENLWNRDPVDFYTPALHSLTAMVMQMTPIDDQEILPLMSVGFLALALVTGVVVIANAIAYELSIHKIPILFFAVTLFLVGNIRFLRYIKEPGYHLQNLAGELLLFGALYLLLKLNKEWELKYGILLILTLVTLVLTHQFSAFIMFFLLTASLLVKLQSKLGKVKEVIRQKSLPVISFLIIIIIGLFGGVWLNLGEKINHIFNTQPHLLSLTPTLMDYSDLLGWSWLVFGLGGLIWLIKRKNENNYLFFAWVTVLLLLSQGPRIFIDIPPVRALFYSAVPVAILAALFVMELGLLVNKKNGYLKKVVIVVLVVIVLIPTGFNIKGALASDNTIRTNSTLNAQVWYLTNLLKTSCITLGCGILTDDYNRRSTSWMILSQARTYSRISADLARQMDEAKQSEKRYQLYLKQLDMEKVFSLGSKDIVRWLMAKHSIEFVAGVKNITSGGFARNVSLKEFAQGGDVIVFRKKEGNLGDLTEAERWLIKPTTLVNDIGDEEDTFKRLPASLRVPRLSEPMIDNSGETIRITTAPVIPLFFNVGDYVEALWDQDGNAISDTRVELLLNIKGLGEVVTINVRNSAGMKVPVNRLVKLDVIEARIDNDGFIIIDVLNPSEREVHIDMIALGLARTP